MANYPEQSHDAQEKLVLGPRTLKLLEVDDVNSIEVITGWHQGGSETYVSDFTISADGLTKHLIAKACIKFGPREAMNEWLRRRSTMAENGVLFPELVLVDGATIVEEFIPYSFKEAYQSGDAEQKSALRHGLVDTFKRICGAGFSPVSLHDVRSRGDDVVVIDVGEDIGGYRPIDSCDMGIIVRAEQCLRSMTGDR